MLVSLRNYYSFRSKFRPITTRIPYIAVLLLLSFSVARTQAEQNDQKAAGSSLPAWQVAAGGKMEFEVASIRLADPDHSISPSFSLSAEDGPIPKNSEFTADFTLPTFAAFAYKILLTPKQEQVMISRLPHWVGEQSFVVHAKSPKPDPSKDQVRLMMQSLL